MKVNLMPLEQIFYLTQSVAAMAVLASLVFVGLEIRQNSREARAQTEQHIASSWFEMGKMIADHPAAFGAGLRSSDPVFADLKEEDRLVFVSILFVLFKHYENIFRQVQTGHIDADTWAAWSVHVRIYFHQPGVRTWWAMRGAAFAPSFRTFLESSAASGLPSPAALLGPLNRESGGAVAAELPASRAR
ncbi:MAG: hypothetical protein PVSMB6_06420 [Steroidobacteraceae bacterium]